MIEIWILFWTVTGWDSSISTGSQEFLSKARCEEARVMVERLEPRKTNTICVRK